MLRAKYTLLCFIIVQKRLEIKKEFHRKGGEGIPRSVCVQRDISSLLGLQLTGVSSVASAGDKWRIRACLLLPALSHIKLPIQTAFRSPAAFVGGDSTLFSTRL